MFNKFRYDKLVHFRFLMREANLIPFFYQQNSLAVFTHEIRSQLQIRCLGYLNDLKFVIFCHSEYVCRSFFKTRNSRTSKFHVVFLFPREFSGVRFTFRIAKHVKFIHFNLPSTIISCARILSKKKNPFIRKWKLTRSCIRFEVDSRLEKFFTSDDDARISPKWMTRWRTGKREFVNIMKSPFISAIQSIWWKCLHI